MSSLKIKLYSSSFYKLSHAPRRLPVLRWEFQLNVIGATSNFIPPNWNHSVAERHSPHIRSRYRIISARGLNQPSCAAPFTSVTDFGLSSKFTGFTSYMVINP